MPAAMRLMDSSDDDIESPRSYMASPTVRRFKDCVHDYMPFDNKICAIIDTPQFQRLRHVKQLGTSSYVWPTASHNRFEHCLGVAYLSQSMVDHLQQSQPELDITLRDARCVTIAGLCHDLGHGPWSHVWDGLFIPNALPGSTWTHEQASEMMFDDLIEQNNLEIDADDVAFIKALIAGDPRKCKRREKPFLFEIVANKRNGLDVDKFDYIARDMHAIDQKGNLSLTRLIHSARVIDDQICFNIKDANQVYELCYTRFSLHKRIYNHKTAKAIEYMLVDALLTAEPYMRIAQRIFDPRKFLFLTDNIKAIIESSEAEELAPARQILHRINTRDLYKPVDFKVFPWDYKESCKSWFTPERIVTAAKAVAASRVGSGEETVDPADVEALSPEHVIVDMSKMHYGMEDRNPLDFVKFYSKHHPDTCQQAELADISLLMPAAFGEVLLRIYTRDSRFFGLIQAGYREVLAKMPSEPTTHPQPQTQLPAYREVTPPMQSHTPPDSETPMTPRAQTRSLSTIPEAPDAAVPSVPGSAHVQATPFRDNSFMSVGLNHKGPPSPGKTRPPDSMKGKKGKRLRESVEESPSKRRRGA
ncbi:HD-domain/PDEase-like protein [Obba rivulosa]|uniref:HD-domain/PDEase-like protein n=1 Tax=Obba rivulosa TaxID=1052685 RepID=A0A8E2AN05_9APHY|nr:HD-domain/PDEase-like protein [Obba rivulosa]